MVAEETVLIMFLKDLLFKNFSIKLVSLVLAVILWSFVVGQEKAEVSLSVPVAIVNIPDQLVISNDFPANVNVRVFGPKMMLARLAASVPSKVIDLKNAREGVTRIEITADDFALPGGVSITRIQPSEIDIVLEHLARRKVPVRARIEGSVNSDYKIDVVHVVPPEIEISGPASSVKEIKELFTRPVNIGNATSSISKDVKVDLPYDFIRSATTDQVKVTVDILPALGMKRFKGVAVVVMPPGADVSLKQKKISVTLAGEKPHLHSMTSGDINAFIDVTGLSKGTHRLVPRIIAPDNMKVIQVSPEKIIVRVKKKVEAQSDNSTLTPGKQ
jgi:YbbR domain-containing protein